MPGFRTHFIFGQICCKELKKSPHARDLRLYHLMKDFPEAYSLGLQGPDIFFYNIPSHLFHKHNIGIRMHAKDTLSMFHSLLSLRGSIIDPTLQKLADAYILGFIGHYTLDTICHPYIHYRTNKTSSKNENYTFGCHVFLETDIDGAMLAHFYHKKFSWFRTGHTVALPSWQRRFLSVFLQRAIEIAYPGSLVFASEIGEAMLSTRFLYDLMEDEHGWKKKLVRDVDKHLFHHAFLSPLIANDHLRTYHDPMNLRHKRWHNPWDPSLTSTADFYELLDRANASYLYRIRRFGAMCTVRHGSNAYYAAFDSLLSDLGNLSYDTGLPIV